MIKSLHVDVFLNIEFKAFFHKQLNRSFIKYKLISYLSKTKLKISPKVGILSFALILTLKPQCPKNKSKNSSESN